MIRHLGTIALLVLSFRAPAATFIALGDLPGGSFQSWAYGISGDGMTTVGAGRPATDTGETEATRWANGNSIQALGNLPGGGQLSRAMAVSGDGSVIVGHSSSRDPTQSGGWSGIEAFRWTSATGMVGLGDLPGGDYSSNALGISRNGTIVAGWSSSAAGYQAFVWTSGGGMVGLGDLPGGLFHSAALGISGDGSVVVGWGVNNDRGEAFRWTAAGGMLPLGDLPGGNFIFGGQNVHSQALAASFDGSIVVGWGTTDAGIEAFRWMSETGMKSIAAPGLMETRAAGVSDDGSVIVGTANGGQLAWIWTEDHGMRNLYNVLVDQGVQGLAGWTLQEARAISADGSRIAGYGLNPMGRQEAWLVTLVPLPAAVWLFSGALALLGVLRRISA